MNKIFLIIACLVAFNTTNLYASSADGGSDRDIDVPFSIQERLEWVGEPTVPWWSLAAIFSPDQECSLAFMFNAALSTANYAHAQSIMEHAHKSSCKNLYHEMARGLLHHKTYKPGPHTVLFEKLVDKNPLERWAGYRLEFLPHMYINVFLGQSKKRKEEFKHYLQYKFGYWLYPLVAHFKRLNPPNFKGDRFSTSIAFNLYSRIPDGLSNTHDDALLLDGKRFSRWHSDFWSYHGGVEKVHMKNYHVLNPRDRLSIEMIGSCNPATNYFSQAQLDRAQQCIDRFMGDFNPARMYSAGDVAVDGSYVDKMRALARIRHHLRVPTDPKEWALRRPHRRREELIHRCNLVLMQECFDKDHMAAELANFEANEKKAAQKRKELARQLLTQPGKYRTIPLNNDVMSIVDGYMDKT